MASMTSDPMTAAMTATEEPRDRTYFGEIVTADAWFAVLEKGVGKRLFDPSRDDPGQRRTVIKLEIDPLKGEYLISQECLHFEDAWLHHTLPSLKALGVTDLATLKGRYCQVKRVATGQTYVNKQGETKDKTALVLVTLYADGAACIQAAEAFFATRGQQSATAAATGHEPAPEAGMPAEQAFALRSLPALWKTSNHDAARFQQLIEQNPLISKYYPWESAAVQQLVTGQPGVIADDELPF